MEDWLSWTAAGATIVAAMIVAANLGARQTGWGFVVFTFGSLCWIGVAALSGTMSLLVTNGVLTLINGFGIWRWLGRQARYEEGSVHAMERSRNAPLPALFSAAKLIGGPVCDRAGAECGTVVDLMMHCAGRDLAYAVVGHGGVGGVGERLVVVPPEALLFSAHGVCLGLTPDGFGALLAIDAGDWPVAAPPPSSTGPSTGGR
ncbi:MAG: PRC-barrel domain-containing protein [Novosphingobium sp.]